ncbi:MAG: aquaporin [Bacteroidetes bacterium]|nr:aquaporin [Bacteroidota bacterium]
MKYRVFIACLYEMAGTALLVLVGLSFVIFINGDGSVIKTWIPSPGIRRYITGFLFGATGCAITLSPVGKISGAHINPTVSFAFYLKGKMFGNHMLGYVLSQCMGAILGALPLLLWKQQGRSLNYGATIPGKEGIAFAFIGELVTSFLLVACIFFFTGHRQLRKYTPYMIPFLFCIMVGIEGEISGTSTNAARSLGPAVVSFIWEDHWLYWIAPICGAALAVFLFNTTWAKKHFQVVEARLAYFHQYTNHTKLKRP